MKITRFKIGLLITGLIFSVFLFTFTLKESRINKDNSDLINKKSSDYTTTHNKINRTVRVSIHESWPDCFLDKQGIPKGLYIDILNEIAKNEDWKIIYVMDQWKTGLEKLKNNEADLKVSIAYTKERDIIYDFSKEPAYLDWANVIVNDLNIQTIPDLNKRKVGITYQGFFPKEFQELCDKFDIKPQYVMFNTDEEILEAVAKKQIDAGVVPHIFGVLNSSKYSVKISPIVFSPVGVFFAVPDGKNSDVLEKIDAYLKNWKGDQKSFYYEMMNKWFYSENARYVVPKWIFISILFILAVLILMVIWVRMLRFEVMRRTLSLKKSEERMLIATNAGNIGIWDWDIINNKLVWDDSMYILYGIDKESFSGAYEAWSSTLYPEDKKITEEEIQAAIRGEREYKPEFRIKRPDGKVRIIKASSKTSFDNTGKALRMIGTNMDITELREAEKNLMESNKQLVLAKEMAEAASVAKGQFLANMSHEIRTPMNGIVGMAELLSETDLDDEQKSFMEAINISAGNLLGIINDILDISKIEAGRLELIIEEFEIKNIVDNVLSIVSTSAAKKNLEIICDIDNDIPKVLEGDEVKIRQVLLNLLSNAVKFTEKGKIAVSVMKIEERLDMIELEFSVSDTGIGISESSQKNLFQPFVQGDLSYTKKYQGTGLGLAISKKIIELLGGTIGFETREGEGSKFFFELLLKKADGNRTVISKQEVIKTILHNLEESEKETTKILVAEDNYINRTLLVKMIKKIENSKVFEASNGIAAVQLFKKERPKYIFMDIQMPLMNGFEALREIRESEEDKEERVKIIAVTAYATVEDRDKCIQA